MPYSTIEALVVFDSHLLNCIIFVDFLHPQILRGVFTKDEVCLNCLIFEC